MRDDVFKRLVALGYRNYAERSEIDGRLIDFAIEKVTRTIKNQCNVTEIPNGLHNIAVNMVCGEFLFNKKSNGTLKFFDVENAIKQIKEGDTTITYAVGDNVAGVDGLIDYLLNCGKSEFVTYRRFAW